MPIQKTEAIVLKSQKLGETSKIITMYTRKFGKEKLVAKGSRGPRSRFWGSLEPLNYLTIVFYRKENRKLQFLSQADIIESFPGIRVDLEKTSLAMAACELVNRTQVDTEPNSLLFQLLLETLTGMNQNTRTIPNYLYCFQVKFLELSGFRPWLDQCLVCYTRNTSDKVVFDVSKGGFVCTSCYSQQQAGILLSSEALNLLIGFQKLRLSEAHQLVTSPEVLAEVAHLLHCYLKFHIEESGNLKSIRVLKQMGFNPVYRS